MHPRAYRLLFPDPGSSRTPSVLRVRPTSLPPRGPGPQEALALEPRELWIAAHVPQLSLLALPPQPQAGPQVVVDSDDPHQRILDVDAQARDAGVRPGMT